ncbi:U-scoloptoxin(16)-Er13a [Frankliniella fusca]|uniref:U-scoloptoxin(16)-Er13a n=1 Tax=Frankliniella fusca TaxID=407009 RepID=A0AAE1HKP9_9NEOP|nr:U-scoloptoxin(16)-Er13a [Frankliniella fusca]
MIFSHAEGLVEPEQRDRPVQHSVNKNQTSIFKMVHQRFLLCALACLLLVAAVRGECGDYKEGQKWQTGPPDTCAQYMCKDGTIRAKTCAPVYSDNPKCKVKPVPAGAQYPACCPTIECP